MKTPDGEWSQKLTLHFVLRWAKKRFTFVAVIVTKCDRQMNRQKDRQTDKPELISPLFFFEKAGDKKEKMLKMIYFLFHVHFYLFLMFLNFHQRIQSISENRWKMANITLSTDQHYFILLKSEADNFYNILLQNETFLIVTNLSFGHNDFNFIQ